MTLTDPSVLEVLKAKPAITTTPGGKQISYPYPSPEDWRDEWIYFLLVDRFNNPFTAPQPNEFPCNTYQGGNFAGIKQQLPYLKALGVADLPHVEQCATAKLHNATVQMDAEQTAP